MRSLSTDDMNVPSFLNASHEEMTQYTHFEGAFFGNLFLEEPVAYTCTGDHKKPQDLTETSKLRICTQPSGEIHAATGLPLSKCGFIITGQCKNKASLTVNGKQYHEAIAVYLK